MTDIIAENLKSLRKEKNLTQSELCNELKKQGIYLERSTYAKYETGARRIPCDVIYHISILYNISIDYIFTKK